MPRRTDTLRTFYATYVNSEDNDHCHIEAGKGAMTLADAVKLALTTSLDQRRTSVISVERMVGGMPPEFVFSNGKVIGSNRLRLHMKGGQVIGPSNDLKALINTAKNLKASPVAVSINEHSVGSIDIYHE